MHLMVSYYINIALYESCNVIAAGQWNSRQRRLLSNLVREARPDLRCSNSNFEIATHQERFNDMCHNHKAIGREVWVNESRKRN